MQPPQGAAQPQAPAGPGAAEGRGRGPNFPQQQRPLTTAGRLLLAGDRAGNIVALDAANGKSLWHSRTGNVSNAPETSMLDRKQYLLVAAGDMLTAFSVFGPQ